MKKENSIKPNDNNEHLLGYLQLIQEPINRMSTTSAIYKGFAATTFAGYNILGSETTEIVDGVVTTVQKQPELLLLILSIVSILVFMVLDLYYLRLERKLRYLYEIVRTGEHPCDYKIDFIENFDKKKIKKAKARVCDCIKSPSIYLFYGPVLVFEVLVFILRTKGVA